MGLRDGEVYFAVPDDGGTINIDRISSSIPQNTWKHVVLTFDGTEYSLYIDGVLSNSLGSVVTSYPNKQAPDMNSCQK